MKNVLFALAAVFLFSGCVSQEAFDALQNRVTALEGQVSSASSASSDAAAAAQAASREASAAKSAADRALNAANEANERAQRISETCCSRK
ncbi:MAG: Lpp/OprI family alanine-zipper lipoprotein [Pseudomonadales bacterium]